ncbi:helix-turn-helix domain-containing protein [Streptomyces canus]|uniref:helix-turn-helix domain-containing protein n=1 Tax=Streptomyces canus TaxID=58343 RepID=UPI00325104F9
MEARARRSWSALRSRSVSWSSQHELAASVGSTREAVAKTLRLLREQGLVRTGPGTLAVADLGSPPPARRRRHPQHRETRDAAQTPAATRWS